MESTLYENLSGEYFGLRAKKEQLNREIEKLTSAKQEIENIMDDIESILTKYGTHVYANFIENKGE